MARDFPGNSSNHIGHAGNSAFTPSVPTVHLWWMPGTNFSRIWSRWFYGWLLSSSSTIVAANIIANPGLIGYGVSSSNNHGGSGTWNAVGLRYNGSQVGVALNGTITSAVAGGGGVQYNGQSIRWSQDPDTTGPANMKAAESAIWSTNLRDEELTALSRGVNPTLIRPRSLAAYWPFWGIHSPEIDYAAGRSATITGSVPAAQHPGKIGCPAPRLAVPA